MSPMRRGMNYISTRVWNFVQDTLLVDVTRVKVIVADRLFVSNIHSQYCMELRRGEMDVANRAHQEFMQKLRRKLHGWHRFGFQPKKF